MTKSRNKITIFNIASTIILQGLTFFSGPIFSGVLGTNNYGIAAVYLTWVQLASTVFSLQAAGTVAVARVNYPLQNQSQYQSSVLSLATISYGLFSIATILGILLSSKWIDFSMPMVLLGLFHGWGLYCVTFMNAKYTYEFKADKNFILSVVTSILAISSSILLIYLLPANINYWGRIIGQAIVYGIMGIFIYVNILRQGKEIINYEYWKFTLPIAIPTVFHVLANHVLGQSDKVMLQIMVNNSASGIYSLSCTFSAVLNTVWHAFNNSWVPFYYEYTRQGQIDKMKKHAKNYIELFTVISCGFVLLAREVFHIYGEKSFWSGTDLIPLFSIGNYFIFLYGFPVNFEFYHKKTRTIAVGTTLAAICNIVLNYLFISLMGILGAVIATAVSHGLQFLFHYFCAKRIVPGEFPFKLVEFVPGFIIFCASCILYLFTKEQWVIRWVIGVLLGSYQLVKIIRRKEIF